MVEREASIKGRDYAELIDAKAGPGKISPLEVGIIPRSA
jgi:hypothetical protein